MENSQETVRLVRLRIEEIRAQRKRRRRILGATALAVCVCIAVLAIVATLRLYRPAGVELADPPMPMGLLEEESGPDPDLDLAMDPDADVGVDPDSTSK